MENALCDNSISFVLMFKKKKKKIIIYNIIRLVNQIIASRKVYLKNICLWRIKLVFL